MTKESYSTQTVKSCHRDWGQKVADLSRVKL